MRSKKAILAKRTKDVVMGRGTCRGCNTRWRNLSIAAKIAMVLSGCVANTLQMVPPSMLSTDLDKTRNTVLLECIFGESLAGFQGIQRCLLNRHRNSTILKCINLHAVSENDDLRYDDDLNV